MMQKTDYKSINELIRQFILDNNDGTTPIIDLVCEFCLRSGLPEELVGDAISEDEDLTKLIDWNTTSINGSKNNKLEGF